MSQWKRVLAHMQELGGITSMTAAQLYGIISLPKRICELQERGYTIEKVTRTGENRYGELVHYKEYFLKEAV